MEDGVRVRETWDACSEPERPVDHDTFFREGCRACMIKLHAWGRQRSARGIKQRVRDGHGEFITIDDALAREGVVLPRAGRLP